MKKVRNGGLMVAVFVTTAVMTLSANALDVEGFESYATSAGLAAKWQDTVTTTNAVSSIVYPIQTLETTVVHGGAKSMKLEYNLSDSPYENQLEYSFADNQDWSGYDQFKLWVRSIDGSTSLERLTFQLKDADGGTIGSDIRLGGTQIGNTWTEWSIDMSGFTGLAAVRKLTIDVSAIDEVNGFGAGTLYFDDMSVVASVPEPGTVSLMVLGGVGMLVALKRRGHGFTRRNG